MKKKKIAIVVVLAVAVVVAAIILAMTIHNRATTDVEQSRPGSEIDTKYGSLYFPEEWEEVVKIEKTDEKEVTTVKFSTEIGDQEYELFSVLIGAEKNDNYVGVITDKNGDTHNVEIVPSASSPEGASDEDMDRYYAMKEDLNYIVERLK